MSTAPILDTHIWIWWMLELNDLPEIERDFLESLAPDNRPSISAISLWEFGNLVSMGRIELDVPIEDWLAVAASPATVNIQPITPRIIVEMNSLPASFHRDPADRLIVATARALKLPLATKDRLIRKSRLVPIWKPEKP
jgi:PIN domain nuclease of toxin-antitoxin system